MFINRYYFNKYDKILTYKSQTNKFNAKIFKFKSNKKISKQNRMK